MVAPFTYVANPSRVLFGPGRVAGLAEAVHRQLGSTAGGIYAGATMHTPTEVTENALRRLRELGCDGLVAVGGGSTTGLGKALALRTDLPQVAVPTAYAGSEMTAILGETRDGRKTTQRSPNVLPEIVRDPGDQAARADARYGAWLCGTWGGSGSAPSCQPPTRSQTMDQPGIC